MNRESLSILSIIFGEEKKRGKGKGLNGRKNINSASFSDFLPYGYGNH